ncbi:N,N-dimethylformamidase beta subunit family domain-containing protein [Hyalangium gracile]|uniref:N,N-dimethylformamidase beta subunit family domain-containing protein n=1 Tax=Hyalangium gracile TaxID=394092 RepID=UPI001CCD06F1|nr:N,N-dimethylformamidase beta subunit family domain-containing protein [Hyalangium gracile]
MRFVSAPEPRAREASLQGDPSWRKGRPASPGELHVSSSTQAARPGEHISVEVSARESAVVRAEVFRLGVYGGSGAAKVWSSEPITVSAQARCARAACPARQSFSFEISRDWEPGLYLVKVTRLDGLRSFTSLVVKERPPEEPRS